MSRYPLRNVKMAKNHVSRRGSVGRYRDNVTRFHNDFLVTTNNNECTAYGYRCSFHEVYCVLCTTSTSRCVQDNVNSNLRRYYVCNRQADDCCFGRGTTSQNGRWGRSDCCICL